ncbi:MAG: heme ABC exporter ATP-binding protein CcmA, partial [Marinomonas sp.]
MQGASITAKQLACRRGDRLLFSKVDFALRSGDALHIQGANGIGKSSLLRILAGLLTPFAGNAEHAGDIALLDERPGLDLDQPLGKALGFWQNVDGCKDVSDAQEALDLEALLDVPVRYLSTGQRKRAAMASILNRGANIWLLDEPLSGLDTAAQAKFAGLISKHIAGGGICVLASHQPVEVPGLQTLELQEFVPQDAGE